MVLWSGLVNIINNNNNNNNKNNNDDSNLTHFFTSSLDVFQVATRKGALELKGINGAMSSREVLVKEAQQQRKRRRRRRRKRRGGVDDE